MTTSTAAASSRVIVRPASDKDLKRFIQFQYDFYERYPHWVPPLRSDIAKSLNPKKNAFFEHGKIQIFLAENAKGEIVGRIAAIVNGMHLKKYEDHTGFFGFFECIEDYPVAEQLFDAVSAWLRKEGINRMRGPVNPSMNDIAGLLVDGFDQDPSVMMPYNPSYYEDYLTRYGFHRAMTMWAYYIHYKYVKPEKLARGIKLLQRRYPDITLRKIDMSRFDEEARVILDIYNDAWHNNWGHVPMTEAEFAQIARDMKQIVDPNIVYFLEDKGTPVAFSISLPNINLALKHVKGGRLLPSGLLQLLLRAKFGGIHECRTLLMGVRQAYQGKGLDAMLNHAIIGDGPLQGYLSSEMSWVLDSNKLLINAMESMGAVCDKEYAMFEKSL